MDLFLKYISDINSAEINISGSKSETNRMLILQALFDGIELENTSNSDDSRMLMNALNSQEETIGIHP